MFKSIFDTIVDKISNLNPVRHFIKYALDRTLNQFLAKQLTLEDFKNGPLNLNNIQINCQKINRQHLISSPYILHHGIIGFLKISLPPLSQISTKSIEITVQNVQVQLKPNKKFAENFKQKMIQLSELNKFYVQDKQIQGEISQNGPVDFFKQLLKNIIMNIKIKVKNIVIKLYMNTPSSNTAHPQYFTMLRIPIIHLQKRQETQIKKTQSQQIKFSILLPQISLHLLRQDINYPDYSNVPYKAGDFPFIYPPVQHPSTILLIGSPTIPNNFIQQLQTLRKNDELKNYKLNTFNFSLTTDYAKKTKQIVLGLQIQNFEVMTSAVQLKIISRFVVQIVEFKKILKKIIQDIKLQTGESVNLMMKKKSSQTGFNNHDFFSSLMMSINGDLNMQMRSSNTKDIFTSIIKQNKSICADINKFNKQCEQQFRKTIKLSNQVSVAHSLEEFQAINFKNIVTFNAQLTSFRIYLLKYTTAYEYKRFWGMKDDIINKKIGCAYFVFMITKAQVQFRANQKIMDGSFKNMKMYNVKLHERQQSSSVDDYYDIKNSMEFYSMGQKVSDSASFIRSQLNLTEFQLKPKNHFCAEEILKMNQDEQQQKQADQTIKKHSLIPNFQAHKSTDYILYKPGFSIHLDQKQNYTKINVQIVTISVNFEILQDLLNIIYPIFNYRRISDMISFKRQELNLETQSNQKKSLFQSQYQYRLDMMKSSEQNRSNKKNILVLEILEVKVGLRKGKQTQRFTNLTKKNKQKIYDEDSFNKQCFCNINQNSCLYAQFYGIQLKIKSMLKFSCKKIQAGIYQLESSQIVNLSSIIRLDPLRQEDGLKFFKQQTVCTLLTIFVPVITIKLSQKQINPIFQLIQDSLKVMDSLLAYKHFLQNQMSMIQHQSCDIPKRSKKVGNQQKQLKLFIDKIFIQSEIGLVKLQKIYFSNQSEGLIVKLSTLVIGLKRDVNAKICEFRNQLMLMNQFSKVSRHLEIPDSDVILEIFDPNKSYMAFKSMEKQVFFQRLAKQSFSINFSFFKKQTDCSYDNSPPSKKSQIKADNTFSQKFKFKQFNSTIQEQGQKFIISLQLTKNIYIYACNGLELLQQKQRILNLVKQVNKKKQQILQIRSQNLILERKQSTEIEHQSIEIGLKFTEIYVDIHPDFINSNTQKILGPTRSVVSLDLGQTTIFINKQKNLKQINTTLSATVYFLYADDRQIALHPLLLKQDPLQFSNLGFKTLLQISKASIKYKNLKDKNIIEVKIKNILAQASLKTISLLKLHVEHFLKHHIQKQMGMSLQQIYQDDQFCNLCQQDYSEMDMLKQDDIILLEDDQGFMIEDLSEALQEYEKKLNLKVNDQKLLRNRKFEPNSIPNAIICIQSLVIQKLTVRVGTGNDFNFLRVANLGNSSIQKRVRNKQFEQQRYLTLNLNNLHLSLDIDSSLQLHNANRMKKLDTIHSFIKLDKIRLTISKQKNVGHVNLKLIQEQIQQQIFVLFSNQYQLCVIFEINQAKVQIKSYSLKLKLGLTSQIITLMKTWKKIQKDTEKQGWKKIYDSKNKKQNNKNKKQQQQNQKKLVILIPQSVIKFSLQYQNLMSILDQQKVISSELLINQQLVNQYVIKKKIRKWIKQLIKNNLGSLISRTALNLLTKLISQIITLNYNFLGKLLSFLFGSSE